MTTPKDNTDDWGPEIFHNVSEQEAQEIAEEALPEMSSEQRAAWVQKMRGQG